MDSVFTKIIKGEIPSYTIYEDDKFIGILDIKPIKIGHTLIIPKKEVDYIFDLDDEILKEMIIFAKKISIGLKKTIKCNRIGMSVIGLEIPHAHIHLIPINSLDDMDFKNNSVKISKQEMEELLNKIRANIV